MLGKGAGWIGVLGNTILAAACLALSYGCAGAWTETALDNGGGGGDGGGTGSLKPVATLLAFPASGEAPLTVALDGSGCWSRTGGSLTYDWDFDGDNVYDKLGGAQLEEHVFQTAGNFTVKLRVLESQGSSNSATVTVRVSQGAGPVSEDPVVSLGVYPASGPAPLKVTLDASGSWAKDGKPLTYEYDYDGDGAYDLTSAEYSVDHIYNAAGTYHPKLRVTDTGGHSATATTTLTVQAGGGADDDVTPVIGLNAYPRSGAAPLKVTLDASASWAKDGKPLHYEYDVDGDGTYEITSDNYAEDYTYSAAGSYTPKLRVTDSQGHSATTSGPQIAVSAGGGGGGDTEEGPVAVVIADPASGKPPLTVTFFAGMSMSIGSAIKQFDWDMDNDGAFELINAGPEQTRSYATEGTYYVNVRVTDYEDRTATGLGVAIVSNLL